MSNRDPHLEVLINRYLDGEISAREMEDLRALLDGDGQAKDLFEQMQQLHSCCQDLIQTYVLQPGRPVEDLIANAWQGQGAHVWVGRVKRVVFSRFVSGLAAGLLIGVFVHLAITSQRPTGPTTAVFPGTRVPNPVTETTGRMALSAEDLSLQDTIRRVDYYTFTDNQGNHWWVEGLSEEPIQPAAYQGDF